MPEITDVKELDRVVDQVLRDAGRQFNTFLLSPSDMRIRSSEGHLGGSRSPSGVEVGKVEILPNGEIEVVCDYAEFNEAMELVHRRLYDSGYRSHFTYCSD